LRTEEEGQMHRRDNLAHFILAGVVALGLTPLMVCVEAQARIAFDSNRDGNDEIYVMDADDGGNLQNLTNNPADDRDPSWSPDGERMMVAINKDSLKIGIMTGIPYGLLTENGLPLRLIGRGTF
jgi:dipeptidyl aminopeptidase/acylaminoacyl peptidase